MIKTKKDYKEYIKADKLYYQELYKNSIALRFCIQLKYLKLMRKLAYYTNTSEFVFMKKLKRKIAAFKYMRIGVKAGFSIGCDCFGKGLILPHYGTIIVNADSSFGDNCVVQAGVNISEGVRGGAHLFCNRL